MSIAAFPLPAGTGTLETGSIAPTAHELQFNAESRHGKVSRPGVNLRRRWKAGYYSPMEHYEVILRKAVSAKTRWLDVGCGCTPLPDNDALAGELANRCSRFVGVDPDHTIHENQYIHEAAQCPIEDYRSDMQFDLITLRMVCEHVRRPLDLLKTLRRLAAPQASIVLLTPSLHAVSSLLARLTPTFVHRAAKARIWNTRDQDTFRVYFHMNSRRRLDALMRSSGFVPEYFQRLADASLFWKFPRLHAFELWCWKTLPKRLKHVYPDACLLAVYRNIH